MLDKVMTYVKTEAGFYTGLFVCLAIGAWFANGWMGKHFSIADLSTIYGIVAAKVVVNRGIDSKWNSPPCIPPERKDQP